MNGTSSSTSINQMASSEENLVSSSSPNFYEAEPPKVVCVAVQTPNKLLKSLIGTGKSATEKGAKSSKGHDIHIAAQAKKEAEKEFKQFAEKVGKLDFVIGSIFNLFIHGTSPVLNNI